MAIKGRLDVIDTARFEREVRFTSANVTGTADVGVYRASQGELDLQPLSAKTPSPASRRRRHGDCRCDRDHHRGSQYEQSSGARRCEDRESGNIGRNRGAGTGPSSTAPIRSTGSARSSATTLPRDKPPTGDRKRRVRDSSQKDSEVFGNEVVLLQEKQDLSAKGNVESTLVLTRADRDRREDAAPRTLR